MRLSVSGRNFLDFRTVIEPRGAVIACDRSRESLVSIKSDQGPVPEMAHTTKGTLAVEVADHGDEDVVELLKWHTVERLADVVGKRETLHSKQGVGVGIRRTVSRGCASLLQDV